MPEGFQANAVCAGIKRSGKLDLALFYSDFPAKTACQFTTSKIPAAPVIINQRHLKDNCRFKAIIVNSGNANAFTGKRGLRDAEDTARDIASALGVTQKSILVASTGIIAKRLPVARIKKAIPQLIQGLSRKGIDQSKAAIMTTDTFSKEITVRLNLGKKTMTICGIAKGAGMIAPQLATMLCFIFTDANITQAALKLALRKCVDDSFNCITIDGCMSTNDSVMLLANGLAKNPLIDSGKNFTIFVKALNTVCLELAKLIVKDAEGATKFIKIKVSKAKSAAEAKKIAFSIANSNLFKTAVYGENPNFGRIVASVGASGVTVKEKDLKISVSPLNKQEVVVEVSVNRGRACAVVYTSDLTPGYIKINAAYN